MKLGESRVHRKGRLVEGKIVEREVREGLYGQGQGKVRSWGGRI